MIPWLLVTALAVQIGPASLDAPAREPQMAASGSMVALTFGAGKAVYFSASHDAGKTFSTPVKVAEAAILPLTRHRGPRIAFSGDAIVITAVGGDKPAEGEHAHGLPSDGDLWAWRSVDHGRTWSKGVRINDVPGAPTEGLHSLAANAQGRLFAAWLDHRGNQGTKLYGAESPDGGLHWSKNVLIYASPEGTICECCHPTAAFGADGQLLVMYRNWLNGSRDMYLARATDGLDFGAPEKLGKGTWKLNGCPMDGGGLVVTGASVAKEPQRVVTAWRREDQIFLASPGEQEVPVGRGADVSLAPAPEGVYAVWTTSDGVFALLPGEHDPVKVAPKGAYPTVIRLPDGRGLAAWESGERIVVQPLP